MICANPKHDHARRGVVPSPPAPVAATENLPARIIAAARSWFGTPFLHQADVKGVGVDCVFLVLRTYQAVGAVPADFHNPRPYPRGYHKTGVTGRYVQEFCEPYFVQVEQAEPGDLALFWVGPAEAHGAIVVQWPLVIHVRPGAGVVEEPADRNCLAENQLASLWRLRALA